MQPSVWGPHLWKSIHYIALGYPENPDEVVKQYYKEFFLNLWKVVPCYKCSVNYKRHLEELPPIDNFLISRDELFKWTIALHNIVNVELGKPQVTIEDAREMYTTAKSTPVVIPMQLAPAPAPMPPAPVFVTKQDAYALPKNILIITLLVVIIFLIAFLFAQKKTTNR